MLSHALGEPDLLRGQLRHFRTYLELLFGAVPAQVGGTRASRDEEP